MTIGRPTQPVNARARPRLRDLAVYLRQLKDEADATYTTLSERTGTPSTAGYRGASTLSHAARATHLPPLETVLAYARAAGDPGGQAMQQREATARRLWKAAAVERAWSEAKPPSMTPRRTSLTASAVCCCMTCAHWEV